MSYMFQPQSCRFMLYGSFNKIINDQLKNLAFDPINGVLLTFTNSSNKHGQSVTVEIDSEGNISRVSLIDPITGSPAMIFDFRNDEFIHYGDTLDLICGHPLFHMLQQTFASHFEHGHYSVTATVL